MTLQFTSQILLDNELKEGFSKFPANDTLYKLSVRQITFLVDKIEFIKQPQIRIKRGLLNWVKINMDASDKE